MNAKRPILRGLTAAVVLHVSASASAQAPAEPETQLEAASPEATATGEATASPDEKALVAQTPPIAPLEEASDAEAQPSAAAEGDPALAAEVSVQAGDDAEADALVASLMQDGSGDADGALAAAESEFKLNIYGFADFTYTHVLNDFAFAVPYPTFMVGSLNLYAGAELGDGWRSLLEFRLHYAPHGQVPIADLFAAEPTRIDNAVGDPADFGRPVRWGGVEIERAWLEYSAHPLLTIRGGQWLSPYGIWNVDHGSPVILGVRRPYVVGEELIPERQTGILIYGSTFAGSTEFGYHLGISNGRGPVDTYQDYDKNKAVTVRLYTTNESVAGRIQVGVSGYRGQFTDRRQRPVFTAEGFGSEYISALRYDELSLSADLQWLFEGFSLQGEFMVRELAFVDGAPRPPPIGVQAFLPDYRDVGLYALAGYLLPWYNAKPFVGFEYYAAGDAPNFDVVAYFVGLNVRPTPRVVLKVQGTKSVPLEDIGTIGANGLEVIDFQAAWSF